MLLKINTTSSVLDFIDTMKIDLIRIIIFSVCVGLLANDPHFTWIKIPLSMTTVIGTAISLLLTFRTGQSYDRWWEARIVWGSIVNDSRSFIRQLSLFLPNDRLVDVQLFAERQITWCYALSQTLRKQKYTTKVQNYIDSNDISDTNVPNAIIALHSTHIKRLVDDRLISDYQQVQLDDTLMRFCDAMGKCERIKNTIFPMSYSKLIHFLIYLFALFIPFSIETESILIKAIITALIPLIFLVIERTAILMQDPFENKPMDTPMTAICQTIEMNLNEMTNQHAKTPEKPKEDYYFTL